MDTTRIECGSRATGCSVGCPDEQRGTAFYENFYRSGGWKYSRWREYWWHRRHFVRRFGLKRGMKLLEVACGNGFHTNLLHRMGFECTGIDRSETGIAWARSHFPRPTYLCCDFRSMPFEPEAFDAVIARGCSHYHYDLMSDLALESTATILRYVKPRGVFVMIIVTDLTGRRDTDAVWQNTLDDYRRHFSSFGRKWSVEWVQGLAVCGIHNNPEGPRSAAGVGERRVTLAS